MRPLPRWLPVVILLPVAAIVAAFLFHYVPFDPASYAAWFGIAVAGAGLVSLAVPLRFLAIRTRATAALVLLGGAGLTMAAVLWPAPVVRAPGPPRRLNDFLPEYQLTEYHEGRTRAPREAVLEAVRRVSFADMPAAAFLMRLRDLTGGDAAGGPPDPRPILDLMLGPGTGFLALDVTDPGELVLGMVGRPWTNEPPPRVTTAQEYRDFAAPGHIRVGFDIRVVDEGGGLTRVSTETRSLGNDTVARRIFTRYWRIIYPGSAIIRRVWLDAIIARAERRAGS